MSAMEMVALRTGLLVHCPLAMAQAQQGHGNGVWAVLVALPQDKTESVSWQKLITGMALGSPLQQLQSSPKLNFCFLLTSLHISPV